MPKVLHCIGEMGYGGAEILTVNICSRLAAKGIEVHLVVIGYCDENLARRITDHGVILHKLDSKLESPVNIIRIIRLIKSIRFDVVHAHLYPSLYWVSFASFFFRSQTVRWVYTEHSTSNNRRRIRWLSLVESFIYRRFTHIICVSEEVKSSLLTWVPKTKNVYTIQNGIETDKFKYADKLDRSTFGFSDDDLLVLMVGAFRPEKNQAMLLNALQHLPEVFKLLLAGDGPELQNVKALAEKLDLRRRVHFLGATSEVGPVMKSSDIYVLCSLFEGFGLSAMEATAAGLPIVVSEVEGLKDIFQNIGILVDPNCATSIASGIFEAARRIRAGTSAPASETFLRQHDIEVTVNSYSALYGLP